MKHQNVLILGLLFVILASGCTQGPTPTNSIPPLDETDGNGLVSPVDVNTSIPLPVEPIPPVVSPEPTPAPTVETFALPELTYENAYNGTLVDTSVQIQDAPLDQLFANMNRNGVHALIGFFPIIGKADPDKLFSTQSVGFMLNAIQQHPGKVIPFYTLGLETEDAKIIPTKDLVGYYADSYSGTISIAGKNSLLGMGELEQFGWNTDANGPKMRALVTLAESHGLPVMFHPPRGQMSGVRGLVESFPQTPFILHMYADDFEADSELVIELLEQHPNVYYSIDADHLLYDSSVKVGLLREFAKSPAAKGAEQFLNKYEQKNSLLFSRAVARYEDLVTAVPDQVMWGSNAGPAYNYDPAAYDTMIEFTRLFIGKMPLSAQEKLAYRNAWNVFGPGATVNEDIVVADTSAWKKCESGQLKSCSNQCGVNPQEIIPASDACVLTCAFDAQCVVKNSTKDWDA